MNPWDADPDAPREGTPAPTPAAVRAAPKPQGNPWDADQDAEGPARGTPEAKPTPSWQSDVYQLGRGAVRHALGAPADIGALLVHGLLPGAEIPSDYAGGSDWFGKKLDQVQNAWDRTIGTPQIGAPPEGTKQRFIDAAGGGVGSVAAPLGIIKGLSRLNPAVESTPTVGALTNFFKKPTAGTLATEGGYGAVSGMGSEAASEAFPGSPLAPLIGGIAAPLAVAAPVAATRGALQTAGKTIAPFTTRSVADVRANPGEMTAGDKIAGQVLRESAFDPGAVAAATDVPPIAGQRPTLGQVSRDPGIVGLEEAVATTDRAPFVAQRSANNQTIREAAGAAAEGDPEAIRAVVAERQGRLGEAAQRGEGQAVAATEAARTEATPTGATREGAAENLHRDIMGQHAASEAAEREAWAPINEVKGLKFEAEPIKTAVDDLIKGLTRSERALMPATELGIVKDWGGTEPFAELTSLKSAVGSARAAAGRAGDANKARVIGKLDSVLAEHLDKPTLLGDALEGEPNAIREAYDNARAVTRAQKQQFNTVSETAPMFQRTGTGDVKVAPTETMARFVKPGPGGKEAFESLVTALGGPEVLERAAKGDATALNHVRDWAQADIGAKPLTTKNLNAWRDKYSGMLEAFPQLRSDLDTIGQRVARQEQVTQRREHLTEMLEKNAANKFMEGDPEHALGQLLKSSNQEANAKAVAEFSRFIKRSPEAADGARRTMVDMLLRSGENAATDLSGDKMLSSAKMVKFYEKNGRVFDQLFPDRDQRALVDRIVQGVRMNGLAGEGATATGGSNTAGKLAGVERFRKLSGEKYIDGLVGGGATKMISGLIGAGAAAAGGVHGAIGAIVGAAEGPKVLKHLYEGPRSKVMDLVQEALRDPSLARDLMREATPRNDKIVGPRLIRFMGGTLTPAKAAADEGE